MFRSRTSPCCSKLGCGESKNDLGKPVSDILSTYTIFRCTCTVIQKYTVQNLHDYTFYMYNLQYFATKLCNFTDFKMLSLAVVTGFVLHVYIKLKSKAKIVHHLRVQ